MRAMRLTVAGSSPAWPNPGSAHAGYLVEGSGRLLLDCGPGVLANLRKAEGWPRIDAIAISHLHLDHWGDLIGWAFGMHSVGAELPIVDLYLPPGGRERLASFAGELDCGEDLFERTFALHEYVEGAATPVAGFELLALRVPHYEMDAYGFRLTGDDRVLAYSGDCAPSEALHELARAADLFVCEATLDDPEPEPRGHLTLAEAQAAAEVAGVRRLLITHRPLERTVSGSLEVAYDGLTIVF
jgi:ribonuclease BN (tRNA processing enzyme)